MHETLSSSGSDLTAAVSWALREIAVCQRPIILLGGGLRRRGDFWHRLLESLTIPVMTTYNGTDRIGSDLNCYFGRPNTWGMRYSNVLFGQADLVIAIGTRLGLQQTGFNYQFCAPLAKVMHIDIDVSEFQKGHPAIAAGFAVDASEFLEQFGSSASWEDTRDWIAHCKKVRDLLPLSESSNSKHPNFWNPYDFMLWLSKLAGDNDAVIPCSSGGAFTSFYQSFEQKLGQIIISDKSLASMGYGLAGALGVTIAYPNRRVIHLEGDGGFSQNLQELATVKVRRPNLKMFILCNDGYASIRMTQRNYFGGQYLGCDDNTGLGFPNWAALADAYGIQHAELSVTAPDSILKLLSSTDPALITVPLHPEQSYFPKISSQITADGSMESEPLWAISPRLSADVAHEVLRYLPDYLLDYYLKGSEKPRT